MQIVNAYTLLDDVSSLADKVQSFFAQSVVTETHDVLKNLVFEVSMLLFGLIIPPARHRAHIGHMYTCFCKYVLSRCNKAQLWISGWEWVCPPS